MIAVLVVGEMPKNCSKCWLHNLEYDEYTEDYVDICHNAEHENHELCKTNYKKRPSWCPLKELPEKEEMLPIEDRDDFSTGYTRGWNECLEEITGEQNETAY